MKFIDLIKEDDQSEWDKLYKKTQLVFKTLRKGRICTKSGVVFSYKIPEEETHISVASSHGKDDLTAYIVCEKIKIKEESKECSDISYGMFGELIKRKFSHFDIMFIFSVYPEDIEKYKHETINEDEDKRIKKARTIYKAFKKGLLHRSKEDLGTIRYVLPDEYNVYIRSIDDVLVIKVGKEEDENSIKFFFNSNDGRGERPVKAGPERGYYENFVDKIREKFFYNFDIRLIC